MGNPLVSIILPVYNAEKYLTKCIESILNQSIKDIELIIIDDGSIDESSKICKQYLQMDNRVKYIHQQNSGPSVARNKGIEMSTGKYIQFIDSDDYLEQEAINNLLIASKNTDLVIGAYKNIYNITDDSKNKVIKSPKLGQMNISEFSSDLGLLWEQQLFHYTWHKLYLRDIVKKIQFNKDYKIGEDFLFNISYIRLAKSVTIIDKIICNHIRYNEFSITKKYHTDLFNIRKHFYREIVSLSKDNNEFTENNKKVITSIFAGNIVDCIFNITKPSAPLNLNEKKLKIQEIITDELVIKVIEEKEQFDDVKKNSLKAYFNKVYIYLISNKKANTLLYFSLILLYFNRLRFSRRIS